VVTDKEKYENDTKWDGLKGYLTNAKLSKKEILEKTILLTEEHRQLQSLFDF